MLPLHSKKAPDAQLRNTHLGRETFFNDTDHEADHGLEKFTFSY